MTLHPRRYLLTGLAAGLLATLSCSGKPGVSDPGEDFDGGPVGPFTMKGADARPVSNEDLLGRVWIASFIFTRCTGPCPQVTATVARLQKELNLTAEPDLRLVTFTVDPERDDPSELEKYATNFRALPDRWLFLTGEKQAIHDLLIERFKVSVAEKPTQEKTPGDEFAHSTRLVLVDRRGHIRGYYDGLPLSHNAEHHRDFDANLAKLGRHVTRLLKESR
jgi:protein SCO1/2